MLRMENAIVYVAFVYHEHFTCHALVALISAPAII
jgi:hypothetical protein